MSAVTTVAIGNRKTIVRIQNGQTTKVLTSGRTKITQAAIGMPGPTGPAGGAASTQVFSQGVPSAVWTIAHGLGYKPNVQSFDSTDDQILGQILHIDNNSLTITFSAATSGYSVLS